MKHESFNESVEMYLKSVSELTMGADGLAPISALADRMGISAVSATEMVHRLVDQGLFEHQPYKGVALTRQGDELANQIIRRHRLWECFLSDQLGMAWQAVHDYACEMEHATPDEVVDMLAQFLGDPTTCPHGNPIPGAEGRMPLLTDCPLNLWDKGDKGTITRLYPESLLLLDYAASQNIRPGQSVVCEGAAPFRGPLNMQIGGEPHVIGREVAAHIFGVRE